MTAEQFVDDVLSKYKGKFFIMPGNHIRAYRGRYVCCPLNYACRVKTKKRSTDASHEQWHKTFDIERDEIYRVMDAADNGKYFSKKRQHALRSRMLNVLGLS